MRVVVVIRPGIVGIARRVPVGLIRLSLGLNPGVNNYRVVRRSYSIPVVRGRIVVVTISAAIRAVGVGFTEDSDQSLGVTP